MAKYNGLVVLYYRWVNDTPVGRLLLAAEAGGLRYLLFEDSLIARRLELPPSTAGGQHPETWEPDNGQLDETVRQLAAWFQGDLREFQLPLVAAGTDFQREVWSQLQHIPWGQTATYGEIARAIGRPTASRAVGLANGRNPVSIIIPCHRVIGSNGQLVGYGGGLRRKKQLLQLEGTLPLSSGNESAKLFDERCADTAASSRVSDAVGTL